MAYTQLSLSAARRTAFNSHTPQVTALKASSWCSEESSGSDSDSEASEAKGPLPLNIGHSHQQALQQRLRHAYFDADDIQHSQESRGAFWRAPDFSAFARLQHSLKFACILSDDPASVQVCDVRSASSQKSQRGDVRQLAAVGADVVGDESEMLSYIADNCGRRVLGCMQAVSQKFQVCPGR